MAAQRKAGGGRGGQAPEGLAGIVRRALRAFDLEGRLPELDLKRRWEEIVGPELARHTQPESLKSGELSLIVPSGVWAQEILALQTQILTQVREKLRGAEAKVLKVRLGKVRRPLSKVPAGPKPLPPLETLSEEIRKRLASIADPEVREVMTRFVLRLKGRGTVEKEG